LINAGLVVGIVSASHLQPSTEPNLLGGNTPEDLPTETFTCRYLDNHKAVQEQVDAVDRLAAEEAFCGLHYAGVVMPPLLEESIADVVGDDDPHPVIRAQRESCSCGEEVPYVIQQVKVIPPKLGVKKKKKRLPRIANRRDDVKENVVDPNKKPTKPKTKKDKKKKKVDRKRNKFENLGATNFDEFRPENADEQEGDPDGSVTGRGKGQGDKYMQKVKTHVDRQLRMPGSIPKSKRSSLRAKVNFVIGGTGAIIQWSWVNKSGNAAFDAMIENTLNNFGIGRTHKLPPPPARWKNKTIPGVFDGRTIK